MVESVQYNQEPPQVKTSPMQSPMYNFGSAIMSMTRTDDVLFQVEMMLRNQREDSQGNIIPYGDPLMNEQGINSVLGFIHALANQMTVMSNIESKDIPILIEFVADPLIKDLMINMHTYQIKNAAVRDKIFYTVLSIIFISLKRAYEEGDRRFWKGSVQEIHSKVEAQKQKSGLLSMLNPWKG
jgi:hypothetical protein